MFDLRRLVHIGRFTRQATPAPIGGILSAGEPIKLVAITQNPDESKALREIADGYGWKVSIVDSSGAAIVLLKEQPTPLVICDRDLTGEDWRDVLAKIAALPQAICVLLASRVADQYWNQFFRHLTKWKPLSAVMSNKLGITHACHRATWTSQRFAVVSPTTTYSEFPQRTATPILVQL